MIENFKLILSKEKSDNAWAIFSNKEINININYYLSKSVFQKII